jgi:DNA repair photolyase
MKRFPQHPIRLDEKEMKTDLGKRNTIFVGSSTDIFADDVPELWIYSVLRKCREHPYNTYLFQSKNPRRMFRFMDFFPADCIFGTTIETDVFAVPSIEDGVTFEKEIESISKAPPIEERVEWISKFKRKMVSIEPIMPFNLNIMVGYIKQINPEFVSIGADSKGHISYDENSKKLAKMLIQELQKITTVKVKDNLNKIL